MSRKIARISAPAALLTLCVALLGCAEPTPLAGERFVMATRTTGDEIAIRHGFDGLGWTAPMPLPPGTSGTAAPPSLIRDGEFYHLYWLADDGAVRYATSRAGDEWLVQDSPAATVPPASRIAVARGGGKRIAVVQPRSGSRTTVVAYDLDDSRVRPVLAANSAAPPTIAFGAGRFAAALVGGDRRIRILTSPDGAVWTETALLPPAFAFEASIGFSDGAFRLATNELSSVGSAISGQRCRLFTSQDAATWLERPTPACGNTSTAVAAAGGDARTIYLSNFDNRVLRGSVDGGPLAETQAADVAGRPSIARGPGPQLASLTLDRLRVEGDGGQDISLLTIGFSVRIGAPGSAQARLSSPLTEIASEVGQGEVVALPLTVSPATWTVTPAVDLFDPAAELDLLGAIVVGIERGDCPEGPIRDTLEQGRAELEAALNRSLATASVADLRNDATRGALIGRVECEVERALAGQEIASCSGAPPAPEGEALAGLARIADVGARFVGRTLTDAVTGLACGFNRDEPLEPGFVALVGTNFFIEEPGPKTVYKLDPAVPVRQIDRLALRNAAGNLSWRLDGRIRFLGLP